VRRQMPEWFAATSKYEIPSLRRAAWQLLDTFVPYFALWALMIYTVKAGYPYAVTLALSVIAAGLLVRMFILFHDCCHGSFFASRRANATLGAVVGFLTFTPFKDWWRDHNLHHITAGDLGRRGTGDVLTMTVEEYRAARPVRRLLYRLYRNPFVMFGLGPFWVFLVRFRFYSRAAKGPERRSVLLTDLAIAAIVGVSSWTMGLRTYLLIQLPVILIGGAVGVWLFYVQHQFERTYWSRGEAWDPVAACLRGSSFYRLPRVLQWFSGNIGLHHIHHLRPRIPNYNLQRCYDEVEALRAVDALTLGRSLRSLSFRLWDEREQRMVGFSALRRARTRSAAAA